MTNKPVWRKVGTVGDINAVDFGGGVVLEDTTGVYAPEVEYYDPVNPDREESPVRMYRFILEPCTYVDGVLSDNPYHPDHSVWFDLATLQGQFGQDVNLAEDFCSNEPMRRAFAWTEVGMYYGFDELDNYPETLSCDEALARFESYR